MNSRIFFGTLRHDRSHVVAHGFSYPLHLYAIDLDELPLLDRASSWFGHNRLRPVALHDRDYLYPGEAPLVQKVERALRENGIARSPAQVMLVTALRQFHYVFNPASFFFCYDAEGRLFAVLLQVNNTFGETHLYVLDTAGDGRSSRTVKVFHVSPFFPREGDYDFDFALDADSLAISITYRIAGQTALVASFTGTAEPFTGEVLARIIRPSSAAGGDDLSPDPVAGRPALFRQGAQGVQQTRALFAADYPRGLPPPAGVTGPADDDLVSRQARSR